MKYDAIYYKAISQDETSPIGWGKNTYQIDEFDGSKAIEVDRMLYMKIDSDIKPLLGDFHSSPKPVFIQRAKEIIEQFSLKGNQLFPITITHKDNEFEDYFILHCHHRIKAMHHERSEFTKSRSGRLYFIDTLSLDENVLDEIPEEERMIFVLKEKAAMILYHENIVKALEAAEVTGVRFVKVKDWNIGSAFD